MPPTLPKDSRYDLEVRDGGLSLAFRLKDPPYESDLTVDGIVEALAEAGVTAEVNRKVLLDSIETRSEEWVEICRGTAPVPPVDGYIEYFVDPFHLTATAKEDEKGKIDYKELNLFLNVSKGQELLKKHDPAPGIEGTDVFGRPIPCGKPREARLKIGPGVELVDEGRLAVAIEDGAITRKSDTVSVSKVYEIIGDVSYRTGNIEFNGSVNISGNILAGFTVSATDDVSVGGLVEAAEVRAGGSVRIVGGVQGGGKGIVSAGENLFARFASDAVLEAGDTIAVEKHLLSCKARAGVQVIVSDDRGSIVGGETSAGEKIEAGFVGSGIGAKTVVALGLTPDLPKRIGLVRGELQELESKLVEISLVIDRIDRVPKRQLLPLKHIETARIKTIKQKFLLQAGIKNLGEELARLEAEVERARGGRIVVRDTVHAGVVVHISSDVLRIDRTLRYTTFLFEEGGIRTRAD